MRIIPAIDIIDGQCVRLTQGNYDQLKVYDQSPIVLGQLYEKLGFDYLHLVDLDGAKSTAPKNLIVLNQLSLETNLKIDFGGGIKSEDSLLQALRAGAYQINIGSIAARNPTLVKFWIMKYGADKVIIGADIRGRKIAVNGWRDQLEIDILEYINSFVDHGATTFVCTDISKDGMMEGSAIELYREILGHFPAIKLIASGGVSSIDELNELKEIGVDGAIIGKAIYENLIDLEELAKWNACH